MGTVRREPIETAGRGVAALTLFAALTRAREAAPIPARSEADRPAPAGWAALRLLADVDISFSRNCCWQLRGRTMELGRSALPNSADLSEPQLRSAERARESATTVGAAEFAIVVDDPVARCARPAPAPSPPPRPGEADVSIGADRPSSIVRPRKCAAPDASAATRKGIKNTSSPAGNVGERARRRRAIDQKEAPAAGSGPPRWCRSLGAEHVILQRHKEV